MREALQAGELERLLGLAECGVEDKREIIDQVRPVPRDLIDLDRSVTWETPQGRVKMTADIGAADRVRGRG